MRHRATDEVRCLRVAARRLPAVATHRQDDTRSDAQHEADRRGDAHQRRLTEHRTATCSPRGRRVRRLTHTQRYTSVY